MNKFDSIKKPLMWFHGNVAGCFCGGMRWRKLDTAKTSPDYTRRRHRYRGRSWPDTGGYGIDYWNNRVD